MVHTHTHTQAHTQAFDFSFIEKDGEKITPWLRFGATIVARSGDGSA